MMKNTYKTAICHPDRKHEARGMCKQCYATWFYRQNRKKHSAIAKAWRDRNPDKIKVIRRKYLYGIDEVTFNRKLKAQNGLCRICKKKPAVHVDHDHKTDKVRGLLCGDCNRAIGLFNEDQESLKRAIVYLRYWHKENSSDLINISKHRQVH